MVAKLKLLSPPAAVVDDRDRAGAGLTHVMVACAVAGGSVRHRSGVPVAVAVLVTLPAVTSAAVVV